MHFQLNESFPLNASEIQRNCDVSAAYCISCKADKGPTLSLTYLMKRTAIYTVKHRESSVPRCHALFPTSRFNFARHSTNFDPPAPGTSSAAAGGAGCLHSEGGGGRGGQTAASCALQLGRPYVASRREPRLCSVRPGSPLFSSSALWDCKPVTAICMITKA